MENDSLKIALISPRLKVADVSYNTEEIIKCCNEATMKGSELLIFPELAVTGATCGDLFLQKQLYMANLDGIAKIVDHSKTSDSTIIFGAYLEIEKKYYDCTFITNRGRIISIVPKMKSVSHEGVDFSRWFADGSDLYQMDSVDTELDTQPIPFGEIIFEDDNLDLKVVIRNGSDIFYYAPNIEEKNGDEVKPVLIINPSADSTQTLTNSHRLNYYRKMSKENNCAYIYLSPGVFESSTDLVFSGQSFAVAGGHTLAQSSLFTRKSNITYAVIGKSVLSETDKSGPYNGTDESGSHNGIEESSSTDGIAVESRPFSHSDYNSGFLADKTEPLPFIPKNKKRLDQVCEDAFAIQSTALATRLEHTNSEKALIGISGGLDSTLALLVTVEAFRLIGKSSEDIITVTMPGLGTSDKTYGNALSLMKQLKTDLREISIIDSVMQHFKDIGHDIKNKNKAYENAQARERTQILMDIANDVNGIVIGTGDLSESALGWCTYGGDHMAMYGVNASIPKTLMPYILNWVAANKKDYTDDAEKMSMTLKAVIQTPISPELLPADEKGEIAQKTEDSVGPYELHDYFIYHTILNKTPVKELLRNAETAFMEVYDSDTVKKWLKIFYSRFFSQQFKRNCCTESPMVTQISLSPRGGLVMPSDAVSADWISELE